MTESTSETRRAMVLNAVAAAACLIATIAIGFRVSHRGSTLTGGLSSVSSNCMSLGGSDLTC